MHIAQFFLVPLSVPQYTIGAYRRADGASVARGQREVRYGRQLDQDDAHEQSLTAFANTAPAPGRTTVLSVQANRRGVRSRGVLHVALLEGLAATL